MLQEVPFRGRFAAAAELGFAAVDIQFPYDHPAEALGEPVTVPDNPQLTGAYGAALLAIEGG